MTEQVEQMDTRAVATIAAEACALSDDELNTFLESFVNALTPDQITNVAARAYEAAEVFGALKKMIESKFAADFGDNDFTFHDERSGKDFEWTARSYRKCDDIEGLADTLRQFGLGEREMLGVVKADGLRITDLRKAVEARVKDPDERKIALRTIESFIPYKRSGRRLRVANEED